MNNNIVITPEEKLLTTIQTLETEKQNELVRSLDDLNTNEIERKILSDKDNGSIITTQKQARKSKKQKKKEKK